MFEYRIKGLKLRISPIFFAFFPAAAVLGLVRELLVLLAFAALHELAHMLAGLLTGYPPRRLEITPLGLGAGLEGLTLAPAGTRYVIFLSGPLVSLISAVIGHLSGLGLVFLINAALFAFNMLPVRTLDGGRVLFTILAKRRGFMSASGVMTAVNRVFCGMVIAAGIAQIVLFPPNATLIVLGIFLFVQGRNFAQMECLRFTHGIMSRDDKYRGGRKLALRLTAFSADVPVKKLFDSLSYDTYSIFYIYYSSYITDIISEGKLVSFIKENGLSGRLTDFPK